MRLSLELLEVHAGFMVARYELPFASSVSTVSMSLADCYSLSSITMRSIPMRERLYLYFLFMNLGSKSNEEYRAFEPKSSPLMTIISLIDHSFYQARSRFQYHHLFNVSIH